MRYVELVADHPWTWSLFLLYLAATAWLAVLGRRRARADAKSFAIARVHPVVAGMGLAAALASTSTFVINPGFVYVHGLSAFLHLGVAAVLGMAAGLSLVCGPFRRQGASSGAVTIPQWIGQRFGSRGLRTFFAAVNLLSLCFVILIVGALSIVMQTTLGLGNAECLVIVIGFVFGYVLLGGAYASAYANTLHAAIKAIVAVMIIVSGLHHFGHGVGPVLDQLRAVDPNLAAPVNPASPMFGSFFSVYVAGFVIGFALMCQPHIMTMALYVKDDRGVRRALTVGIALSVVFAGVLLAGLYARLDGLPPSAMIDPVTHAFRQDRVMATYLASTFSPPALALVTIAVLAAGMSALSAILMTLSSITGQDLWVGVLRGGRGGDAAARKASRVILLALGVLVFVIALDPPALLGIFGQLGAYGVVSATAAPLVVGALSPALGRRAATVAAVVGPLVHFGLYFGAPRLGALAAIADALGLDFANPGVTATAGILASTLITLGAIAAARISKAWPAARADLVV
jgi:SSS family solute:Na+ symporter/sodium/pantothenate symporter